MNGIRAWTIQPWEVWDEVRSGRGVTVDWRYVANLHHSYDWLREQLMRRLPGYVGHYPWWAYGARPDLRAHRHFNPRGETCALIELVLPPDRTVVLPFWAWDRIFMGQYVDVDRQVAADWNRRLLKAVPDDSDWPPPEPWRSELYASWERIFEPEFPACGWHFRSRKRTGAFEVVFEVLDRSIVTSVTPFRGADKNRERREFAFGHEWHDGPSATHR